jgi:hypothetical protein
VTTLQTPNPTELETRAPHQNPEPRYKSVIEVYTQPEVYVYTTG